MSSPAELRTSKGLPAEEPARPSTPTTGGPCACRLITAMSRTARLIDEQPNETIAAEDLYEGLHRLRESVAAALTHADLVIGAGQQPTERACPDDMRRGTRVHLDLELIHDVDPDELVAMLLSRVEHALDVEDIDVADIATRWEPRPPPG